MLSLETSLSLVLEDTTSSTPLSSTLYEEPAAVARDSNEELVSLTLSHKEDLVKLVASDLEGSFAVPEPSEVSQVPSPHLSSQRSV